MMKSFVDQYLSDLLNLKKRMQSVVSMRWPILVVYCFYQAYEKLVDDLALIDVAMAMPWVIADEGHDAVGIHST